MQLAIKKAKDGNEILEVMIDERKYALNSTYRPLVEAEKFAAQYADVRKGTIIAVFGYGNGMFPEALVHACRGNATFLFYEPCKEIASYANHEGKVEVFCERSQCKVSLFHETQSRYLYQREQFSEMLETVIHYGEKCDLICIALPRYKELFPEEYRKFEDQIRYQILSVWAAAGTAKQSGHYAVKNNICNLFYIENSYCADDFAAVFPEEMPVVIVSAGPSLEKNIHWLRKVKDKALILCVDRAARNMLAADIMPDIILTIDPVKPVSLFEDKRLTGIPLAGVFDMNTEVLKKMESSKVIFVHTDNPLVQKLYGISGHDIMKEWVGGSVATFAFRLCCMWKVKTIILVGQDLAMTGNQCYAGERMFEKNSFDRTLIPVEDVFGDIVYTTQDYYMYLKWFESEIEKHPELNVIDATEGGAKIVGTNIMTLEDVVSNICKTEYDMAQILEEVKPAFDAVQKETVRNTIDKSRRIIYDLEKKLQEEIQNAESIIGAAKKRTKRQRKGMLQETGNEWFYRNRMKHVQGFLQYYEALDEVFVITREIEAEELEDYLAVQKEEDNLGDDLATQFDWIRRYLGFQLRAVQRIIGVYEEIDTEK